MFPHQDHSSSPLMDECAYKGNLIEVLETILQYSPDLPLKFFIISRSERRIQNVFYKERISRYSEFVLHEIDGDTVSADIAIYVREELANIAKELMAGTAISGWPSEDRLNTLVRLSGTSFIYAATACEYIGGGGSIVRRLEDVTNILPNSFETSALDILYGRILSAAVERANPTGKKRNPEGASSYHQRSHSSFNQWSQQIAGDRGRKRQ